MDTEPPEHSPCTSTPLPLAGIHLWELETNSPEDRQFEQHLWGGALRSATQNACPPALRDPSFAQGSDDLNSEHQCYPVLKHMINHQSALPSFLLRLPLLYPHYTANHQQDQTEQVGAIPFLANATSQGHSKAKPEHLGARTPPPQWLPEQSILISRQKPTLLHRRKIGIHLWTTALFSGADCRELLLRQQQPGSNPSLHRSVLAPAFPARSPARAEAPSTVTG